MPCKIKVHVCLFHLYICFFKFLYRGLRDSLILLSGMLGTYLNILVSGLPNQSNELVLIVIQCLTSLNISAGSMDVVPSLCQLDCLCYVWGHTARTHGLHFLRCYSLPDVYFVHDIQQSWCLDSCLQVSIWRTSPFYLYWVASATDLFCFCIGLLAGLRCSSCSTC